MDSIYRSKFVASKWTLSVGEVQRNLWHRSPHSRYENFNTIHGSIEEIRKKLENLSWVLHPTRSHRHRHVALSDLQTEPRLEDIETEFHLGVVSKLFQIWLVTNYRRNY